MTNETTASERERFERYATSRGRSVYRADQNGPYGSDEVRGWWLAWQAALPAPADQPPSQEARGALDALFRENEIPMSDRNGALYDAISQAIEAPSQEAREYPPLPDYAPVFKHIMVLDAHTRLAVYEALTDMLRSYVDADRKARQQEALDARRWRYWRDQRSVTIDTALHGNGCRAHSADELDAATDAAIAKGEQGRE